MNKAFFLIPFFWVFTQLHVLAQSKDQASYDSLKRTLIQVDQELYAVQLNLHQAQSQLQNGILVATLGYTITIIGGQLLGTKPELGETLLYAGGATGIVGTVILFKGFKKISLGPPIPRNR
jgi:hypothetical protein